MTFAYLVQWDTFWDTFFEWEIAEVDCFHIELSIVSKNSKENIGLSQKKLMKISEMFP